MCSVVALLLLSSCNERIPDAVRDTLYEQFRQREFLRMGCSADLQIIKHETKPYGARLDVCWQHQRLVEKMARSLPRHLEGLTEAEIRLVAKAEVDYEHLVIELCYAEVRLKEKIKDQQSIADMRACDRLVDEKRHQETLEAIERASKKIQRDIFMYRHKNY
jgi:hypothetical protein